jgi:hypothetical protein
MSGRLIEAVQELEWALWRRANVCFRRENCACILRPPLIRLTQHSGVQRTGVCRYLMWWKFADTLQASGGRSSAVVEALCYNPEVLDLNAYDTIGLFCNLPNLPATLWPLECTQSVALGVKADGSVRPTVLLWSLNG